jgi:hypothetical protein
MKDDEFLDDEEYELKMIQNLYYRTGLLPEDLGLDNLKPWIRSGDGYENCVSILICEILATDETL